MIEIMQKLGRVGSKLGLLGAQCWARVGPGLMKFNPGPGWVGFWAGTLGPKWALRKSTYASTRTSATDYI